MRRTEALLVIDMQAGFDGHDAHWGGARNNPEAEANGRALLAAARARKIPVLHAHHHSLEKASPLRRDRPGGAPMAGFEPLQGEAVFAKHVNSAFIGTGLEAHLRDAGIKKLTIFGLTTEHCVNTTTRMAGNLGFEVTLVGDACAAFPKRAAGDPDRVFDADLVHDTALAMLDGEFARVATADEVLASWR